jgi:8-oxo-dGTP diphosphatase
MGPIWVVRHATAGHKKNWQGDDDLRPLDGHGRRQAEALAGLLAGEEVIRLRSSATTRCLQTLEPLARRLGLGVEHDPSLRPDAGGRLLELLARTGRPGDVLCTHGELLRPALRALRRRGAVPPGERDQDLLAKGGAWALDPDDLSITRRLAVEI